jgi:hypothetical protein
MYIFCTDHEVDIETTYKIDASLLLNLHLGP